MTTHDLKTLELHWNAVQSGDKNFEVRKNDRSFQKGDTVRLFKCKLDGDHVFWYLNRLSPFGEDDYSSWHKPKDEEALIITKEVSYVFPGGQFGIEPTYCVLDLKEPSDFNISAILPKLSFEEIEKIKRALRENEERQHPLQPGLKLDEEAFLGKKRDEEKSNHNRPEPMLACSECDEINSAGGICGRNDPRGCRYPDKRPLVPRYDDENTFTSKT